MKKLFLAISFMISSSPLIADSGIGGGGGGGRRPTCSGIMVKTKVSCLFKAGANIEIKYTGKSFPRNYPDCNIIKQTPPTNNSSNHYYDAEIKSDVRATVNNKLRYSSSRSPDDNGFYCSGSLEYDRSAREYVCSGADFLSLQLLAGGYQKLFGSPKMIVVDNHGSFVAKGSYAICDIQIFE